MIALLLLGCGQRQLLIGQWTVDLDQREGRIDITHPSGAALEDLRLVAGVGSASVEMNLGSFKFEDLQADLRRSARARKPVSDGSSWIFPLEDEEGATLGTLALQPDGENLVLSWAPLVSANMVGLDAACTLGEPMLGLGSHAFDVDHTGESFALWVSEPGVGKVETENYPDDWYRRGTRHATSFSFPFLLRPAQPSGLLSNGTARVDVELCAEGAERLRWTEWDTAARWWLIPGDDGLDVVRRLTDVVGRPESAPPAWVFLPWNDAIRGSERVREVAEELRAAGAPATVIWTEDWRGAEQTNFGYHLRQEWTLDETLYPDAQALAEELHADGFMWFAYFAHFLVPETQAWEEASQWAIQDEDGEPYLFMGFTFDDTSLLDLTDPDAQAWAVEKMQACLDLGFDGWMADFAEWLPTDAHLASGEDPWQVHNRTPVDWQGVNAQAIEGRDASFFVRSGWTGTSALAPVVWLGDQRTNFQADDGMPTVIPLALGLSAAGVPVVTHDVAGYQSLDGEFSTKEVWWRWASFGAFSPILRTHHGAFDDKNWQFDTDAETLAFWAEVAREHTRLFPYRYGLAAQAVRDGTPMLLSTAMLFEGEDWGRIDAWMLGSALLVAPVMEEGATGRDVALPAGPRWFDWFTHAEVQSGRFESAVGEIPVFVPEGSIIPTFDTIPDTALEGADEDLVSLQEADLERVLYVFGAGGRFVEADGTTYTVSGTPTAAAEAEATLSAGTIEAGGATIEVEGNTERHYRVVVVP